MTYRSLIKDLKQIVSAGLAEQKQDMNLATTYTNWELGKRLVEVEQEGEARAAYGQQVLEKVSADLKQAYGRGYSVVNLRYMRQFSQLFKKKSIRKDLQWSHYRLLVQVKDETRLTEALANSYSSMCALVLANCDIRVTDWRTQGPPWPRAAQDTTCDSF